MRAAAGAALAGLLAVTASGCTTTQEKSAKLARESADVKAEKGVVVTKPNPDVRVLRTTVLSDANGSAIAVRLRNSGKRPLADVPLAVALKDARGEQVFSNATPGLQRSLTHAAVVPRGESLWVNDQVFATQRPKTAEVKVGVAEKPAPARVVAFTTADVRLERDPVSGLSAIGVVANPTAAVQRRVLVTAVARRGGRIVAVGRAIVAKVKPRKRARFRVFFIGSPKGAELDVSAQPAEAA